MKLPNFKQKIHDIFHRDGAGKFVAPRVKIVKWIWIAVAVLAVVYGIEIQAIKAYQWGQRHGIQKPLVVFIGKDAQTYNGTIFSVEARPVIYDLPPVEIISPIVHTEYVEVPALDEENLTDTEKKILKTFGIKNFIVFRALAQCESGQNENGINWDSHDVGIMQINWDTWEDAVKEHFGYDLGDMFDEDKNIEVAYWIYDRDGDGKGSIEPWVASRTECFRGELVK